MFWHSRIALPLRFLSEVCCSSVGPRRSLGVLFRNLSAKLESINSSPTRSQTVPSLVSRLRAFFVHQKLPRSPPHEVAVRIYMYIYMLPFYIYIYIYVRRYVRTTIHIFVYLSLCSVLVHFRFWGVFVGAEI